MIRKLHIAFLILSLMTVLTTLRGQTDTLCVASPSNNYFVINTPGSTYQWETNGDGLINSGQGTSSVNITWLNGPGLYQLSVTETNADGCPGPPQTLNILILDNLESISNVSICQNELPFNWNGQDYFSAGTYSFVTTSASGCDSTAILNLSIDEPTAPVISCGASSTSSVSFNWLNMPDASGYSISYTINGGSAITAPDQTENTFVVTGLNPGDQVLITVTPIGVTGSCLTFGSFACEAEDCVPPDIIAISTSNLQSCEGSTVNFTANVSGATGFQWQISFDGGNTFTNITDGGMFSGANSEQLLIADNTGLNGAIVQLIASEISGTCPSTSQVLSIQVFSPTTGTDVVSTCESFTWIDGITYTTSTNTPTFTIPGGSVAGCDSVITLDLTINDVVTATDVQSACGSFTWVDGITYTISTNTPTFTIPGGSVAGCDSVITLNLTINDVVTSTDVQSACGSFTWIDGITYTTSTNTPTFTIPGGSVAGCDSVITLTLTINDVVTATDVQSACGSFTWIDGVTYTTSTNTPTFTIPGGSVAGCDSVITLNLTINDVVTATDVQSACGSFTWIDGVTYTTSTNTPTFTIPGGSVAGCDSVITLDLTINDVVTATDVQSACGSFTWIDGITYTTSTNTPTFIIPGGSVAGCDSVITLDLTINDVVTATDVQSACGSFTWIDGNTYTTSTNTPTFIIPGGSVAGCDSIITLDLTINDVVTATDVQSACGSFTWIDGVTYTTSTNTPTFTISGGSAAGCDSVITLDLTININSSANINATICEGETFELNGSSFNQSGVFNITIGNAAGCDSIITLNLLVNPIVQQNINEQICEGESFLFDGNEYSSSGTYVAQFTGSNGCDSLVTLNLLVVAPTAETINASICDGDSITVVGNSFSTTGTYIINTTSSLGCDSIITLNLLVNQPTTSFNAISICEGSSYTFNGNVYTQTGIYTSTLINSAGCDSIATLELTVNGSIQINQQSSICQGDAFILPDGSTVNASGVYTVTLSAAAGCDSVVVTTLTVLDAIHQNVSASICQGESFILPNGLEVSQAGVYTSTFTSSSGCDSTITVTITVQDAVQINLSAENDILSICHGTSTTLTATGASNYIWSPAASLSSSTGENVIASPLETTTYLVTGTTGACSGTTEITITVLPAPALVANPQENNICFGESVELNVSGAESYSWSPAIDLSCADCPNPTATPTENIAYQVIGTVGNCIDTINVMVNVLNVTASIIGDTSVCFNDSITLIASGGGAYLWSTGDTTAQITFAPFQSGYHAVLVNLGGCIDSASIFVHVRPFPIINAGNDTTIYPGGSVPIMVEGGGYTSLSWNPTSNLTCTTCPNPIATPDVSTTYCVTAVSLYGCAVTDCIKISIDSICGNLFVPNVFSPVEGGHRENDCFRVYGTDCVASLELSVYNRWGEKVYETNKIDDCWDGNFRGKELNSAVFVYQLKAKLHSGETIAKQGNVTLLR